MNKTYQWIAFAALVGANVFGLNEIAQAAAAPDILKEWNTIKAPPAPTIKAVTVDPKKTAFFALDFNGLNCIPAKRVRCAAIIQNVKTLLDQARAHGMPIVITYTHHMTPKDLHPFVTPQKGDIVYQGEEDKLYNNDVAETLKAKGIDTILMTGTSTNGALLFSAFGAALRGFKIVVPIDAAPSDTAYQEQFSIWELVNAPEFRNGNLTTLTRSDMVTFGASPKP
jgi:nicotinamidase-related amidase